MIFMQANNNPNVVAERFLAGLRRGEYQLGFDTLKDLNTTVTLLLAFVRNKMNVHAPINALPAELLQLVFQHTARPALAALLQFDARGPGPSARMHDEIKTRLALTHVCRRWRAVALGMGPLWTLVDDEWKPEASSAFLARSKAAPLHAHVTYAPSRTVAVAGTALTPHAARLRSLALTLPAEDRSTIPSASTPAFAFAAPPNLSTLALTTHCAPFDDRRPLVDLGAPRPLFAHGTPPPNLRRLLLRNMCWVPHAPYDALTHLFLTEGTSVPLRALLRFLGRCAALEALVLVDVNISGSATHDDDDDENDDEGQGRGRVVRLPRLRRCTLGIGGALLNMRSVLQHVELPAGATLRVSGGKAFHALSHLQPFPDLAFARALDTLSVDLCPRGGGGGGGGGVVIRASGPSCGGTAEGPGPGLLLDLPTYRGSAGESKAMGAFMRSLVPFERLVEVRYRVGAHEREPMHVLGDAEMPALRTFRLQVERRGGGGDEEDVPPAFVDAVRAVLGRCPGLSMGMGELEVWASGDGELPGRIAPDGVTKVVVHCGGRGGEERLPGEAALRERVGDVEVCGRCACTPPSMTMPGTDVDWVEYPYEW